MSKEAISTERALKLALEALKQIDEAMPFPVAKLAQAALREALAEQPAPVAKPHEQEPVACVQDLDEVKRKHLVYEKGMDWKDPLYTSPPQRTLVNATTWRGLSDEEKRQLFDREDYQGWLDYINAIEAKLRSKNEDRN